MSNKKQQGAGLMTLVAGLAAGAAAVFLAKKENREKTKKVLQTAEKKVTSVSREAKKDPQKFAHKVERKGKVLAKKVLKEAGKDAIKFEKKAVPVGKKLVSQAVAQVEKEMAPQVKSSPVLKVVGKKSKAVAKKVAK